MKSLLVVSITAAIAAVVLFLWPAAADSKRPHRTAAQAYWHAEGLYTRTLRALGAANKERRALRRQAVAHKQAMRTLQRSGGSVGASQVERNFLCIYAGENAGYGWTVNTGNGYYGGLQMDYEFQQTYGPEFLRAWGTADHWPVSVQLAVAIRAYLSGRGYYPWPTTARNCGLIR